MSSLSKNRIIAITLTISFVGTSLLAPFTAQALTQEAIKKHQTIDDIFNDPKMQRDVAMIGVTCVVSAYLPTLIDGFTQGLGSLAAETVAWKDKQLAKVSALADPAIGVPPMIPAIAGPAQQAASKGVALTALAIAAPSQAGAVPIITGQFDAFTGMLTSISLGIDGLHYTTQAGFSSAIGEATKKKAKDTITDCLVYGAGQLLLKQLTQDTVNWIKGGYHGSPSFAVDTHEIFLDLADSVAGDLAREIRGVAMCRFSANFQNDLANNIELSAKHIYKFNGATKCPFPETFNINSSDFYKGVNQFSWGAMEYAMQDNGNPFGVALLSGQELALRSSEKKDVQKQELSWSNGFTNMVDTDSCNYPEGYTVADGKMYHGASDAALAEYATRSAEAGMSQADYQNNLSAISTVVEITPKEVNTLQKTYCKTTTPGKMVGDALSKATGIDMDRLGLIDSVNKIVGAVIEQATQSASMGIFNAISGQDAKVQQNYITVQDKTAETIAMENYAIKNAKDALAEAKLNLQDENAKEPAGDPEKIYLLQQAVDAAQKKVDAVTSVESAIARQAELTVANAEVATALSAERIAQARADVASKAYYDALSGTLSGGTYIQPDPATLANLKSAWDNANNAFVVAQGVTANARQRLYDAQHPGSVASTPSAPAGGGQ